ncbi:hypothetical protein [Chryseobacterium sp. W4I1]|uniref:hypothetical protein n=1 Tax=Chryseobacterium sp. W4I1 TaxID=3042293 RepID=UPI0027809F4D|nr:hypothetical protein [Chryseobacterium sp. W4I1]MDQ0780365.1 hypothetical protein [Chryseobacterium sp. W4I1]
MKTIFTCLIFLLLLINCKKENKNSFFNENLTREILRYQKKNQIPTKSLYKLFIYEISFSKQKDTILTITVNPTGIQSKNSYGIYKNKTLKPSYVIDNQGLGKKFIKLYKRDNIENYILKGLPPNIDVIYPVYKYNVKDDKLILIDSLR